MVLKCRLTDEHGVERACRTQVEDSGTFSPHVQQFLDDRLDYEAEIFSVVTKNQGTPIKIMCQTFPELGESPEAVRWYRDGVELGGELQDRVYKRVETVVDGRIKGKAIFFSVAQKSDEVGAAYCYNCFPGHVPVRCAEGALRAHPAELVAHQADHHAAAAEPEHDRGPPERLLFRSLRPAAGHDCLGRHAVHLLPGLPHGRPPEPAEHHAGERCEVRKGWALLHRVLVAALLFPSGQDVHVPHQCGVGRESVGDHPVVGRCERDGLGRDREQSAASSMGIPRPAPGDQLGASGECFAFPRTVFRLCPAS